MVVLTLPEDSVWQAEGSWPISYRPTIYVRLCYEELYKWCVRLWDDGTEGLFLMGTPGVGKSCFLDYVLDGLLKAGKKVLLLSGPRNKAWMCSGYNAELKTGVLAAALVDRWAKDADYVLLDPHENPAETEKLHRDIFCLKPFLIAMSPDPRNCKKIVKDTLSSDLLYMGPTSLEEAEDMRDTCYNRITSASLKARFAEIGGIPRFLFRGGHHPGTEDAALASHAERQTFALNDTADNPMRIDPGMVASQFESLWSLYHLRPIKNYSSYTIELCSDSAFSLLRSRLMRQSVQELCYPFHDTSREQGTLRGLRFEAYSQKKILVEGVNSKVAKRLKTSDISSSTANH